MRVGDGGLPVGAKILDGPTTRGFDSFYGFSQSRTMGSLIENDRVIARVEPVNMLPRLAERAGLQPSDITQVFLTNFHPLRRRGLAAFEDARWHVSELEREAVGAQLVEKYQEAERAGDGDLAAAVRAEVGLLQRCKAAPEIGRAHV